jgi:gas vesicle protein
MEASQTIHGSQEQELRGAAEQHQQGGGNLDKIREILFGSQMRGYESRFRQLEELIERSSNEIRETTRRRVEDLERFFQSEINALEGRLRNEREERLAGHNLAGEELRKLGETIQTRLTELQEQALQSSRDLRREILDQSKRLDDEIQSARENLSVALERKVQELRHAKTDRSALAAMLNDLAMRLNGEFAIPGLETPGAQDTGS